MEKQRNEFIRTTLNELYMKYHQDPFILHAAVCDFVCDMNMWNNNDIPEDVEEKVKVDVSEFRTSVSIDKKLLWFLCEEEPL